MYMYQNEIHYGKNDVRMEILCAMDLPCDSGTFSLDKDRLVDIVLGNSTEEELLPYGTNGMLDLYETMCLNEIDKWLTEHHICFDEHDFPYLEDWEPDEDSSENVEEAVMDLIESEDWETISEKIWEDLCSLDVVKYGINNLDDYKMSAKDAFINFVDELDYSFDEAIKYIVNCDEYNVSLQDVYEWIRERNEDDDFDILTIFEGMTGLFPDDDVVNQVTAWLNEDKPGK